MSPADQRESMLSTSEADRYTPVSGLAIAALLVSAFSLILIAGVAIAAKLTNKPAYQPVLLVPALFGFVLALIARWVVKHGQGARTGLGFTTVALWLSGLGGGCFAAYMATTELAIRGQARAFTEKWIEDVGKGPPEHGFLGTVEAERRPTDKNDIAGIHARFGAMLYVFRDHELCRLIRRAAGQIEVISRGIQAWENSAEGYYVEQVYQISCREGDFSCTIAVLGHDNPAMGGRTWKVLLNKSEIRERSTTELGRLMIDVQFEGRKFLRDWTEKLNNDKSYAAFLDTLSPDDRQRLKDQTDNSEYQQFLKGSLIRVDGKEPTAEDRAKYQSAVLNYQGINLNPGSVQTPVGPPLPEWIDGRLRISQMVELNLVGASIVAYIVFEPTGEQLTAELKQLMTADWKSLPRLNETQHTDAKLSIDRFADHGYRILAIDVYPRAVRLKPAPGIQR